MNHSGCGAHKLQTVMACTAISQGALARRAEFRPIFPHFSPCSPFFVPVLGIWYLWILTQFHPFSHIFCSFPPHPLLSRLISPHYTDPEKEGVM